MERCPAAERLAVGEGSVWVAAMLQVGCVHLLRACDARDASVCGEHVEMTRAEVVGADGETKGEASMG